MHPATALIFDLDDTLYAEQTYTFSGYRAVADAFASRLAAPFDLYARMRELFDGPSRHRVFNIVVEEAGVADGESCVTEMVEHFRNHTPNIALFPDAETALERWSGTHALGVISDGFLVAQTAKVEALGLAARVAEIVLTDTWGREYWKPHPRAFETIAARLGADPQSCVYIGDNRAKDFVAPNVLGWRTVCVDRPTGVHREAATPPGGKPHFVLPSLDNLDSALR